MDVHMTNVTLMFSRLFKGRCYGNSLFARISENWHTPPSFCVLVGGLEDRNTDAHVNTADDPPRLVKIWRTLVQ